MFTKSYYNLILSIFDMKTASLIFTLLFVIPVVCCLYIIYVLATKDTLEAHVAEEKVIVQSLETVFIFSFSLILNMRKRYFENILLFGFYVGWLLISFAINHLWLK
jgi:uncharacterized paraquat-inducible protein A